jgi:hypothetical protein
MSTSRVRNRNDTAESTRPVELLHGYATQSARMPFPNGADGVRPSQSGQVPSGQAHRPFRC